MAADLDVRVDVDSAVRALSNVRRDQLPFATSLAVNWTALGAQRDIRAHVRQEFTLRRPDFILKTIKVEKGDWATKRNPLAFRLKIDDKRYDKGRRDLLAKFEAGGTRARPDRDAPVFIPSEHARPQFAAITPKRLFPFALRLQSGRGTVGFYLVQGSSLTATGKRRKRKAIKGILKAQVVRTERGIRQWRGKARTFVLDPLEHQGVKTWGVYQRTGPKREDVQLLWTYKARSRLPARLRFVATAQESADREFARNFRRAYAQALATARPAGGA